MGNNNYARGAAFERKVKEHLESFGWLAIRAAGSHGLVDVIGIDQDGGVHLIQCKTGKAKMSKQDWDALCELGDRYGAWVYEVTPETYKENL